MEIPDFKSLSEIKDFLTQISLNPGYENHFDKILKALKGSKYFNLEELKPFLEDLLWTNSLMQDALEDINAHQGNPEWPSSYPQILEAIFPYKEEMKKSSEQEDLNQLKQSQNFIKNFNPKSSQ